MKRSNGNQPPASSMACAISSLQARRYTAGWIVVHPPIVETMASRPVVLVTGAARRVGREIVLHLAAAGWDVALHYRESEDEAEATAVEARAAGSAHRVKVAIFGADLSDETRCRASGADRRGRIRAPGCDRQQRLDLRVRRPRQLRSCRDGTPLARQYRAGDHADARAVPPARGWRPDRLRGQPERPEAVQPESRPPVVHPVEGGTRRRHRDAGAGLRAAAAGVRSGARA